MSRVVVAWDVALLSGPLGGKWTARISLYILSKNRLMDRAHSLSFQQVPFALQNRNQPVDGAPSTSTSLIELRMTR